MLGLFCGFLFAGAAGGVAGLWRVDDAATAVLMQAFYKQLLAGVPTAEALRHAQQTLRKLPKFASPYYWAPFTLTGSSHSIVDNSPLHHHP